MNCTIMKKYFVFAFLIVSVSLEAQLHPMHNLISKEMRRLDSLDGKVDGKIADLEGEEVENQYRYTY